MLFAYERIIRVIWHQLQNQQETQGVKNGTKGMDFNNYASNILTLEESEEGTKRFSKKQKQT